MQTQMKIFDEIDRTVLLAIILGVPTNGIKIAKFLPKIKDKLRFYGVENLPTDSAIRATLRRGSNNQPIWRAAYAVVDNERPGLFEKLRSARTIAA